MNCTECGNAHDEAGDTCSACDDAQGIKFPININGSISGWAALLQNKDGDQMMVIYPKREDTIAHIMSDSIPKDQAKSLCFPVDVHK